MALDGEPLHILIADLDAFVIGLVDERGPNGETSCGLGITDTSKHEID